MDVIINLAFCFLPLLVFFLFILLAKQDISLSHSVLAMLLGFAPLIPVAVLQLIIPRATYTSLVSLLFSSLFFNGLIEEGVKAAFLFLFPSSKLVYKQFFIYSLLAGLCFGCFEAVVYVVSGIGHVELRFITSIIIHTVCSGMGGLFVWSCRQKTCKVSLLLTAIIIHGIYNFFASFIGVFWWFSLAAIVFALVQLRTFYKNLFKF